MQDGGQGIDLAPLHTYCLKLHGYALFRHVYRFVLTYISLPIIFGRITKLYHVRPELQAGQVRKIAGLFFFCPGKPLGSLNPTSKALSVISEYCLSIK
jgi:hypothetical protein